MKEYGSHDGNTHLRSRYSQGVVTPYRPEISDRSIRREQLCFQDYARDCGWPLNNLIQYFYRELLVALPNVLSL